jgi:hypothetical protein
MKEGCNQMWCSLLSFVPDVLSGVGCVLLIEEVTLVLYVGLAVQVALEVVDRTQS